MEEDLIISQVLVRVIYFKHRGLVMVIANIKEEVANIKIIVVVSIQPEVVVI